MHNFLATRKLVAVLKAADTQVAHLIVCLLFEHGISMQEYKTRFCGTKAIHAKPAHVTQPLNASRVTTGLLQVLTLSATDCGPPKQMPSDIIVASHCWGYYWEHLVRHQGQEHTGWGYGSLRPRTGTDQEAG